MKCWGACLWQKRSVSSHNHLWIFLRVRVTRCFGNHYEGNISHHCDDCMYVCVWVGDTGWLISQLELIVLLLNESLEMAGSLSKGTVPGSISELIKLRNHSPQYLLIITRFCGRSRCCQVWPYYQWPLVTDNLLYAHLILSSQNPTFIIILLLIILMSQSWANQRLDMKQIHLSSLFKWNDVLHNCNMHYCFHVIHGLSHLLAGGELHPWPPAPLFSHGARPGGQHTPCSGQGSQTEH